MRADEGAPFAAGGAADNGKPLERWEEAFEARRPQGFVVATLPDATSDATDAPGLPHSDELSPPSEVVAPTETIEVATTEGGAIASLPRWRRVNSEERKAIELRGMHLARAYFESHGWEVSDVSARRSYDLLASRSDSPDRMIEVKATTGCGERVVLTRNEVENARLGYPHVTLAVITGVKLTSVAGEPVAAGGALRLIDAWTVEASRLTPTQYSYEVPPDDGGSPASAPGAAAASARIRVVE